MRQDWKYTSSPSARWSILGVLRKSTWAIVFWVASWTSHFFFFSPSWNLIFFFFSNYSYSNLGIWQTFSQKQMKLACHFRENLSEFVVGDKVGVFKLYYNLGKLISTIVSLTASQCFKYFFLMRSQWKQ